MKWNLVFHLKRTSKEMLNLRRHYFVIWCASPLSLNPSPSIPLSWWDGWWWTCVRERKREGGRKRGIIPSEYMMNVVIGLKLTGGRVAHRDRERACEWHRAPSSTLPLQPLLVSPSSSWRETEGITQQPQQVKERMLCSFSFSTASVLNWATKKKRKEQKDILSLASAHPFFPPSVTSSRAWGGEGMLNNMTDCEEGEGGPNSQGEWRNMPWTD